MDKKVTPLEDVLGKLHNISQDTKFIDKYYTNLNVSDYNTKLLDIQHNVISIKKILNIE